MLVLIKRQRIGPHLGAIGVEYQRRIFRRDDPGAAGELVVKLLRRPAGIAERDQALPISCSTSAASLKATRPSMSRVCDP
jgi:hypothetical protein